MNPVPSRRLLPVVLLACAAAGGADVHALKMEIVRTPEGHETVLEDSVVIVDGDTRITAGRARMNEYTGISVVADSVFIETPDAYIWADSAVYYMDARRTELHGEVVVQQESLLIFAPLLVHSTDERLVVADSGLAVRGLESGFELEGKRGRYDLAADTGVVDSEPRLVRAGDEDSVTVTAGRMTWHDPEQLARACGTVVVNTGGAVLTCDTLDYFPGGDSGVALGGPAVADSASRTAGDTIVMRLAGGELQRVTISGNATGCYKTGQGDEVEVAGQSISMAFEGGEVTEVEVSPLSLGRLLRRLAEGARP